MRRKISLYIGGELADLDDQSFILFNYTMEDLSNPTIVKNSFTQQITLPGTPNNNAIFGDYFRLDRQTSLASGETGYAFNPAVKTPFSIYNELGEILESGYCKLDEVTRSRGLASYKVTLYGGLGSFFFSLSYLEDGTKRTLADLDYLGNGDPAELDFTINASAIRDAWDRLDGDTSKPAMWDVINFAPAYNGYPENFSPDKGLLSLPGAGLPDSVGGYSSKSGYGLVNLANKMDEWAVKDIRSYLQRPVLSVSALFDALTNPDNTGGYQVDISSISTFLAATPMWITLPTIPSLGSFKQDAGTLALSLTTSATPNNDIGRWDITGDTIPFGAMVNSTIRCKIRMNTPAGADSYSTLYLTGNNGAGSSKSTMLIMQMVAYGSDNTIVGGSAVKVANAPLRQEKNAANAVEFQPAFDTEDYEAVDVGDATKVSSGLFEFQNEITFQVEAKDAAYYKLMVYVYEYTSVLIRGNWYHTYGGDGSTSAPVLYATYSTSFTATSCYVVTGSGDSVTMTASDTLRSNARITKQMLLSTSGTPADYLLSFCKMFGFYFITDTAEKRVTIVKRDDLYIDETIDLTEMVDTSRDITIQPLLYDSKWYRFSLDGVGGAFFDEYRDVYGFDYGIQLIDTSYDFNEDVKDLLDTSVFKNAAAILQRSRYWNIITNGATFIPSPFVDKGNTITRWNASGETQDTPISCPPSSVTITYYNTSYNGYDKPRGIKMQFADASGKMVDGKDVLLVFDRFENYDSFKITDDLPVMTAANDGSPCWILDEGAGVYMPIFSKYITGIQYSKLHITFGLDFSIPRQMDIPGVFYNDGAAIYARGWQAYLADRYDVDTTMMRCRVNFKGIKVGQDLLRRFFYYDNTLWVLNKIVNYSMTTFDPVECEFIRVQDKDNYLIGQNYY